MKVGKSLQKTKSSLKHRFWTEIYDGAKVFDFTGTINGKYLKHQVRRLALYINRVKFIISTLTLKHYQITYSPGGIIKNKILYTQQHHTVPLRSVYWYNI